MRLVVVVDIDLVIFVISVQHDVVSGLKYLQVVKRKGVRGQFDDDSERIGNQSNHSVDC